ncbi:MAG: hypothetical protein IKP68_08760 [Clostridia bacterium]|nr:hypothetical protein [Clostridia bacterium]
MEKTKRRFGDRHDARRIRPKDCDSMHVIMPYMMPNRSDNEAVMRETIDLTAIEKFIEKKNVEGIEFKYTFFHVLCAALAKTIVLRPKLNRFYQGKRLYQRNDIVLSFVVKKKFVDTSPEALAILKIANEGADPLSQVYEKVKKIVYTVRVEGKNDETTDTMDILKKFPRWMLKIFFGFINWLDYHGKYPLSLEREDPYFSTAFITNLGSIKMHADYHHLANWGTNSIFCVINEKKPTPFYKEDGTYEMRDALEIGLTIDERIADGLYFANSLKIFRALCASPELLELPIETPVEYQ